MQADRLLEDWGLELQVFGVANSQWMLLSASPISLRNWEVALKNQVSLPPRIIPSRLHFSTTCRGIGMERPQTLVFL